jgi:hypothetical protein
MSNKTIAKFGALVILFAAPSVLITSCSGTQHGRRNAVNASEISTDYSKPTVLGHIESGAIVESSGVAASPCQPDVLWTMNDSGDDAFIYLMTFSGKDLGKWRVKGARNDDWEDLAAYKDSAGTCYLYVGDIGNNDLDRAPKRIYRIREPAVSTDIVASRRLTGQAEILDFTYPDAPHNAEAMMVHPGTGSIYIMTKRFDGPSLVFKIAPNFGSAAPVIAERVAEVSLPAVPNGLVTGAAISPDGKRIVVCDYTAGYLLDMNGSRNFDE